MPWNALWFKRNEPLKKHHSFLVGVRASSGLSPGPQPLSCSISAGCPHPPRRLSGPAFECMRECAHLMKAEQPRNLGYMQLTVIEVTNCQITPQLLKYFSEVQPFVRKPSCKRPLAHSHTASNVFHEHSSMRKQRRDRVLNSRAQLAHIISPIGQRRFAIFQEKVIEISNTVNNGQRT